MATLDDKARKFLDQPFVGTVTTLRQDGSPHSTVVWVDANGDLSFNTASGRAKERHLRRDPRVRSDLPDLDRVSRAGLGGSDRVHRR